MNSSAAILSAYCSLLPARRGGVRLVLPPFPGQLGPDHIRTYQVYLFRDCKLSPRTIEGQTAGLRFLFIKTLGRAYLPVQIPFPKCHKRLPTVLSQGEVTRLIECCGSLMQRAMVMTLYATGLRRAELCRLKVADVDSQRMVLHVQQGKCGRDRDVPLSPKLLGVLREYWRWMKPKTYLFPGMRTTSEPTCRSPRRWSGRLFRTQRRLPASRSESHHIRCATASQPICSKPVPICARSRCCLDMRSWPTRRSTCTSPQRHLQGVASPLEAIDVSETTAARHSRRRAKR